MKRYVFIFCLFLHLFAYSEETHKIVYLISPPRSLSVGFLRMIEARGDFKIYHEPTLLLYHQRNHLTFSEDWFRDTVFQSFDYIKETIFKEDSHVFVKEMGFHLKDFIDDDLIKRPNVYFVFLFRNPHHTIVSLYNKIGSIIEDFYEATGYKASYEIFQKIMKSGARQPLVLFSEELASQPERIVKSFCDYAGISFLEHSLSWENLGENFGGHEEWHENKKTEHTQHWHGNAIQSTKFEPLKNYDVDDLGNPTFSEIVNLEDRKQCEKAYLENLPYYLYFREKIYAQ